MTPVRLEPAGPRSQVKHSTTEPLHSLGAMQGTDDVKSHYEMLHV